MGLTPEERATINSDIDNMQVAADTASDRIMEYARLRHAFPALTSLSDNDLDTIKRLSPALLVIMQVDEHAQHAIEYALMHMFLTGVEWGKAGRELYHLPSQECTDPTHSHYKAGRN